MSAEKAFDQVGAGRAGALQVVNAAEKAVLEATACCEAGSRDELRLAERFLAIARQRLLLNDWDGAGLFGRQAKECAERVALEKGTTPFVPDQRDPS